MDSDNLGTYARVVEADPLWAEVVERDFLASAANRLVDPTNRTRRLKPRALLARILRESTAQ